MAAETDRQSWGEKLRQWCGSPRAVVRTVLQLDDTPHSIALGSAIGMWIALTPTPGIQMALVMAIAFATRPFLRWNRVAGLLMCYVSNPLTGVPILWTCFKVGTLFVDSDLTFGQIRDLMQPTAERPLWGQLKELLHDLGWPMLIGTLIVCTLSALATYPCVYWLVAKFQKRHGLGDANGPVADCAAGCDDHCGCVETRAGAAGGNDSSAGGSLPTTLPLPPQNARAAEPRDAMISA